jgi:hypothetical protein
LSRRHILIPVLIYPINISPTAVKLVYQKLGALLIGLS